MDISTAQLILKNLITEKTQELASIQLASDLFDSTYKPNFDALAVAQKEANDQVEIANVAKNDAATQVADALSKQTAAEADASAKAAEIDSLTAQVDTLTVQVSDLTAQVATLTPAPVMTPPQQVTP